METIRKIRLALSKGMSIREAAKKFTVSRNTVRKVQRSGETSFVYRRKEWRSPVLEGYINILETLLEANADVASPKRRRTVLSLYEELQGHGYQGSYSSVRRYADKWKAERISLSKVYVPLTFSKGEAFQFDWSEEEVEIGGAVLSVGVAHFRLCHSRMSFLVAYAKTTAHPEMREKSIYAVFEEEREFLVKTTLPFDSGIAREVRVSSQCLVNFDSNRYSVPCTYANKSIQRRAYAGHVRFYADGQLIAEHGRIFERDKTICDPLHYLPVLERKPGALRNGRPFRDWALPPGLQSMREILENAHGGDRQLAGILAAIPQYGEEAVNVACELALEAGLTSKDAVLNILCRATEETVARDIAPPEHLRLLHPPQANCAGYERLLGGCHGA